jgi:hypothetical protein
MMAGNEQSRRAGESAQRARENSAHLHRLLGERHPGYLAALRSAERQVALEFSHAAARIRQGGGRAVNTTDLYHSDGAVCADRWSCARSDHTTIPPKCGAPRVPPAGCELPAGHPGPHVPAT